MIFDGVYGNCKEFNIGICIFRRFLVRLRLRD